MVSAEKKLENGQLVMTDTGNRMARKQRSRLKVINVIKENRALRASRELQVLRVNRENQDSRVLQVKTVIPIFQVKTDSGTRMK